jgi:hypothetical protein
MRITATLTACTVLLLCACDSAPASGGDGFVKFHPQEEFCVEYRNSGMMNGTSVNCMRKWGTERVEIEDFVVGIAGVTRHEKAHKIYIGDRIYVLDTDRMTGTVTENPIQEELSNTDPIALGEAMMASWNMTDTGQDKVIAGVECNVMSSPQMGSVCLTDNLVMLEQSHMGVTRIATSVDLTSGGDEANYTLHEQAELTEGPDIEAIMKQI